MIFCRNGGGRAMGVIAATEGSDQQSGFPAFIGRGKPRPYIRPLIPECYKCVLFLIIFRKKMSDVRKKCP
jgi:hypothetical protein